MDTAPRSARPSGRRPATARTVALATIRRVTEERGYSNLVLAAEVGRSRLSGRDRRLAAELALGTLRRLLVLVPDTATVQKVPKLGDPGTPTDLMSAKVGQQVVLWTSPAPTTLKAQRGDDLSLSAALVSLVSS